MEQLEFDGDGDEQKNPLNVVQMDIGFDMLSSRGCGTTIMDLEVDPSTSNIDGQMIDRIMHMQTLWDKFKAPVKMQDRMMKMFLGVQPSERRKAMTAREK